MKYSIRVPMINPNPPQDDLGICWVTFFETNYIDEYMTRVEEFLMGCFPMKMRVFDEITPGEAKQYVKAFNEMISRVKTELFKKGYPIPNVNELKYEDLVAAKTGLTVV